MTNNISCSDIAVKFIRPSIPKDLLSKQECFIVLCLNAKSIPIGEPVMVAMGTLTYVEVHPRDVFRVAIERNSFAVIIAHNHPSGDSSCSSKDVILTNRLKEAGEIIGIPILDHLILVRDSYVSMADRGII